MLRRGQIKKLIYRSKGARRIYVSDIYMKFWPNLLSYVKKYHKLDNGHPMRFDNCPISLTAIEYVKYNNDIFNRIDHLDFVSYICDYYKVNTMRHKKKILKRLILVIESIKKNGYAKGEYKEQLIGVVKGVNPYFGQTVGYELISGKHRAASVVALGYKKIKCEIFTRLKQEF